MNPRAYLLAVLLVSPALAREPAGFDLKSDAMKKIVQDTAATQSSYVVQAPGNAPEAKPAFKYLPPEKPEKPISTPPPRLPAESPRSNSFVSSAFEILVDELLDIEDDDGVTSSNEMLRCRVQKDLKTSPPGPDNCPTAK
jgi:hypothetical protein